MATMTVSYATKQGIAELLRAGWKASVVEHLPVTQHYHLTLVDDLEEVVREGHVPGKVGLAVENGKGAGWFVTCASADEAYALLVDAVEEADG